MLLKQLKCYTLSGFLLNESMAKTGAASNCRINLVWNNGGPVDVLHQPWYKGVGTFDTVIFLDDWNSRIKNWPSNNLHSKKRAAKSCEPHINASHTPRTPWMSAEEFEVNGRVKIELKWSSLTSWKSLSENANSRRRSRVLLVSDFHNPTF